MSSHLPAIFGAASFGNRDPYLAKDDIKTVFATLDKHGVTDIDSAQLYGKSQDALGQAHAGDRFTIHTKWADPTKWSPTGAGLAAAWATTEYISESAKKSIEALQVKQVDIFYLHLPDKYTPIEETLAAVDAVYKQGLFKRFGLSNFTAEDVQNIYDLAAEKGYVKPSVYQGNYSAAARHAEARILPTLRKLGISFYAYSPVAGGLLTRSADEIRAGKGRFEPGGFYANLYSKPAILESLDAWNAVAVEEGVSRAELAYRWVSSNSALSAEHGDKLIVGASSIAQLDETLANVAKGPLSAKAAVAIDKVWETIKHEAPLDNFNA